MSIILVIDGNDTYRGEDDVFYIHPSRIGMLKHVQKNTFTSCQIKNSPLESLTPLNLVTVFDKLIPNGKMEIELDQPLSVMQNYDAKQVESNAKLAGFDNIEKGALFSPSLSTVHVDWRNYGEEMAKFALDILNGKEVTTLATPVKIIKRQSSMKI